MDRDGDVGNGEIGKGSGGREDREPEDKALEIALSWHLFRASLRRSLVWDNSYTEASRDATLCLRTGT